MSGYQNPFPTTPVVLSVRDCFEAMYGAEFKLINKRGFVAGIAKVSRHINLGVCAELLYKVPGGAASPQIGSEGQFFYCTTANLFKVCFDTHLEFEIVSLGRDGREGGTGVDADIRNWEIED